MLEGVALVFGDASGFEEVLVHLNDLGGLEDEEKKEGEVDDRDGALWEEADAGWREFPCEDGEGDIHGDVHAEEEVEVSLGGDF